MGSCTDCGDDLEGLTFPERRKRCRPCARRKGDERCPKVSDEQAATLRNMPVAYSVPEAVRATGLSYGSIYRFMRYHGLSRPTRSYTERTVAEVFAYYREHGRSGIEQAFPGVNLRSIMARGNAPARQGRWSGEQLVQAARMAGLVPLPIQSGMFDWKPSGPGAIRALWRKKTKQTGSLLHGLRPRWASVLCEPSVPVVTVAYTWANTPTANHLVLWCDMAQHLRPNLVEYLKDAVMALTDFQKWLYRTDDPRKAIVDIIKKTSPTGEMPIYRRYTDSKKKSKT